MKHVALDLKTDVKSGEGQSINAIPITLIGRAGVVGQNTQQSLMLLKWNLIQQLIREIYLQEKVSGVICESAQSLRVGIPVGDVGFDIENRCPIHQIRATHMQNGTKFLCFLHFQQANAG